MLFFASDGVKSELHFEDLQGLNAITENYFLPCRAGCKLPQLVGYR